MNAQHTPGPWIYHLSIDENVFFVGTARREILDAVCRIEPRPIKEGKGVNEANARLIAQAPAMLEALEDVLRYCVTVKGMQDVGKGRTVEQMTAYDKAMRVIREAKGEYDP